MGRANNTARLEKEENLVRVPEKATAPKSKARITVLDQNELRMMELNFTAERSRKIQRIKKQLAEGNYLIDSYKVAAALLKF